MAPISIFKKSSGKAQIDIQEAFNIFSLLRARYISVQTIQVFRNMIHDRDFDLILQSLLDNFNSQVAALEQQGKRYSLNMPDKPPLDTQIATSPNEITDLYIYKKIYLDMIAQLLSLAHAIRSTTTNDALRQVIIDDLTTHIKDLERLYKFGKLKAWEDTDPAFKVSLPQAKEQLSTAEAFHIWDHIGQRYDQIQLTSFFSGFIHDQDFKLVIQAGLDTLNRQVKLLEQQALKYKVPLPGRPPVSVQGNIDPETLKDKFMYGMILSGVLTAVDMHIRAVVESIRNDSLRQIWFDLFTEELNIYDKLLKYGKMKGWTKAVPIFGEPVS